MPIPAGVIRDPLLTTAIALIDMAPQLSRPAHLNGPHDPQVTKRHLRTMTFLIIRPKCPKNIGDLYRSFHGKPPFL
jgi:hypothetical protein